MDDETKYRLFEYKLNPQEQKAWLEFGRRHKASCDGWAGNIIKEVDGDHIKVSAQCIVCRETQVLTEAK